MFGVNIGWWKILAFTAGNFLAGLAGEADKMKSSVFADKEAQAELRQLERESKGVWRSLRVRAQQPKVPATSRPLLTESHCPGRPRGLSARS